MIQTKDITDLDDIKVMVNSFYDKVRKDDLIGGIFNGIIKDNWDAHLDKMYRFWQTVLLLEHTYSGSPFKPHVTLPVDHSHFDRWMKLFTETLNENFSGKKADEAIWRAEKMAQMFQIKIDYYRNNSAEPLL